MNDYLDQLNVNGIDYDLRDPTTKEQVDDLGLSVVDGKLCATYTT